MKTFKLFAVIAVLLLSTASCVENSEKYKTILAERDSLQMETQTIEAGYNETIEILNEVEAGFAAIRESEGKMTLDVKSVEGNNTSKKQQIAVQLNQVKEILAQNKKRIEQLQRQSAQSGKANSTLAQTIKRLEMELEEKSVFIASLEKELANRKIIIEELTSTVNNLNTNIVELNQVSENQQDIIKNQDTNLNKVWYTVATASELKDAQIVSSNGLFRPKTILDKDFDRSAFKQADLRIIAAVTTDSKRIKILSSHPQDSYNLVTDDNKLITIEITDPAKFWSVTKYLIVQK